MVERRLSIADGPKASIAERKMSTAEGRRVSVADHAARRTSVIEKRGNAETRMSVSERPSPALMLTSSEISAVENESPALAHVSGSTLSKDEPKTPSLDSPTDTISAAQTSDNLKIVPDADSTVNCTPHSINESHTHQAPEVPNTTQTLQSTPPQSSSSTNPVLHLLHAPTTPVAPRKHPKPLHRLIDDNRRFRDLVSHLALTCDRLECDLADAREQRDSAEDRLMQAGTAVERASAGRERAMIEMRVAREATRKALEDLAAKEVEKDELRVAIEEMRRDLEAESQLLLRVAKERDAATQYLSKFESEIMRFEDILISSGLDLPPLPPKTNAKEPSAMILLARAMTCIQKVLAEREIFA
ncbi:hypothetical protein BC829DRAFT_77139 [Chytridium lagenaria]|nr:hypothetical protein BC829DRAFT_77139 [Chytridium lagenaria]